MAIHLLWSTLILLKGLSDDSLYGMFMSFFEKKKILGKIYLKVSANFKMTQFEKKNYP